MELGRSLFSIVVNMSLTGSIVIVAVMIVRLCLRRAPKMFSYLLWAVVLLRLLCPFSFSSVLSVFQMAGISVTEQGMMQYVPRENGQFQLRNDTNIVHRADYTGLGGTTGNQPSNSFEQRSAEKETARPLSWDMRGVCSAVWILGMIVLWAYSAVSVIVLKRKLIGSVLDENSPENNIYLCDYIRTAFVMGVLRPRIYLPTTLSGDERRYILLHEETHIRRGDHIWRLLAFLALSIHWFNPLVWCAFFLSERDMEMSCDEAVMCRMGTDLRAAYSASLLNLASGKKVFAGAPLGFGEGSVKCRIQNIMRYKKTAALAAVPVLVLVLVVIVALGSNPAGKNAVENDLAEMNTEENGDVESSPAHGIDATDTVAQQTGQNGAGDATDQQGQTASIAVRPAVITDQMVCDITGPILDYADENILIFHHYFGLFVYDVSQNRLDSSVNLKALGCLNEQEELDCEVFVSSGGDVIYIHPADAEEMYVYDVLSGGLVLEDFDRQSFEHNTDLFLQLKPTRDYAVPDYTVWRSRDCVTSAGGGYLYLECGSGMVEDLYYVEEQDGEWLQYARIFEDNENIKEGGLFDYGDYTGYLDECTDWDGYGQFVHQDYDGDGRIDHVYRENIEDYTTCTYRIEFGNGDIIQSKEFGMGMPTVQTCDLNGDGVKEILIQVYYGFSTDPNYYGETALFEKKNGSYEPLMPPEELCTYMEENDLYNPSITVICRNQEKEFPEWASMPQDVSQEASTPHMHLTVKELTGDAAIDEVVLFNSDLMVYFDDLATDQGRQIVSYDAVIVSDGRRDQIEFHFEALNKWSLDEIVVTAAYENGALHVVDSRYVREADLTGAPVAGTDYDITPTAAAVEPMIELFTFEEASRWEKVKAYDDEAGGMLPGMGTGTWYSIMVNGVQYIYGKLSGKPDEDTFHSSYELYSWAIWDESHRLANGIQVGMTRDEVLAICPNMRAIGFETEGYPAWNGTAYPDCWTDAFDGILITNIEDGIDNTPVYLALMMKDDKVLAITKYEPTAG